MSDVRLRLLGDQKEVEWAKRWFPDLPSGKGGCRIGWTLDERQSRAFMAHYPHAPDCARTAALLTGEPYISECNCGGDGD